MSHLAILTALCIGCAAAHATLPERAAPTPPTAETTRRADDQATPHADIASSNTTALRPPATDGRAFLCEQRFTVRRDNATLQLPYCSNVNLDQPAAYAQVTRIVFSIHGIDRNARDYYARMATAAADAGATDTTIIVAPQFLKEEDITNNGLSDKHIFWTGGWGSGSLSKSTNAHPRPVRISSYAALDQMIEALQAFDLDNLEHVVIAGHSAGGQLVNRYAATHPPHAWPLRYIVMNPSSYLYFSNKRWIPGSNPIAFAVPNRSTVASCTEYNAYRYGLDEPYQYLKALGRDAIRTRYLQREVVTLLGSKDNNTKSTNLSTKCQSMLQGAHRLERGEIYYHHLVDTFDGEDALGKHRFARVPGVGHSSTRMFTSPCGLAFLFEHNTSSCVQGI